MAVVLGQTDDLLPCPADPEPYREAVFEWLKHAHRTFSSIPRQPKDDVIKDESRDFTKSILEACAVTPNAEYTKKVVAFLGEANVEVTDANNEM